MVPSLLAFVALAQTSPATPVQEDPQPIAVVLSTEDVALVRKSVVNAIAETNRELAAARKAGDDTSTLEAKQRGLTLLDRTMTASGYPSAPPTDLAPLRKWLYLHSLTMSAVESFVGTSQREGRKNEADAAAEVARRLGQQYESAVDAQPEGTLKSWGYFDKKVTQNFKADPVVLDEWFSELTPMAFQPKSSSPAGALQVQTDLKAGETIVGERRVVVELKTANLPTKVEMYVDGELRATSEARPFQFRIEPLDEHEGDLDLKFVGYDEKGTRAELPLKVKVATGSEKGAAYNVQKAREALANQDYARAERLARVALRADGDNTDAKLLAASASFKRGRMDLAEKFALDVEKAQPDNLINLDLLAGINVAKSFDTLSTGDATAAFNTISDSMAKASEYRKKVLDARADAALAQAKSPYEKADAHITNFRYSLAIEAIKKTAEDSDYRDNEAVSRLVFAMLRQSRFVEVQRILARNALVGQPDAYISFLRCVVYDQNGENEKAIAAYKKAISGGTTWTSKTFDAYLTSSAASGKALRNYMTALKSLVEMDSTHPITSFYALKWAWARGDVDRATTILRAGLTREPADYDLYVEQGMQQLGTLYKRTLPPEIKRRRVSQALASFNAALKAKPDSPEALSGYALVSALAGDWKTAINMADAARRSTPNYASGYFTYATLMESQPMGDLKNMDNRKVIQERHDQAVKALDAAVKMDARFKGQAPRLDIAVVNFFRYGRPPVVATPAEAYAKS